jgi:hypothetical protein
VLKVFVFVIFEKKNCFSTLTSVGHCYRESSGRTSGAGKWRSAGCRCRVHDSCRRWCDLCECVVRLWPVDAAHSTAIR